tara:strand:- start:259 stop:657 length:399 start_codon:yes stop_codon:yes gene_type:complete
MRVGVFQNQVRRAGKNPEKCTIRQRPREGCLGTDPSAISKRLRTIDRRQNFKAGSDQTRQMQQTNGHGTQRQHTRKIEKKRISGGLKDLSDLAEHGFQFLNCHRRVNALFSFSGCESKNFLRTFANKPASNG